VPLHEVERQATGHGYIYAGSAADQPLPKYRLPEQCSDPKTIFNLVRDELLLDGTSRQNLATFCTTFVDDEARHLMDLSVDKNMIDKDEYPQSAEIEKRCVHILADLWHAPKPHRTIGCSTTGSSEACMLGGLALKWQWRKRRKTAGKPADKPNIVTGPVQVCWEKFARYFDVEIRQVPLSGDSLGLQPQQLKQYCDENTIGVVATLGITFTCVYEPVRELAAALDALQKETGLDIPIHVDAASGGFIAPFIQPDLEWDFRIARVKSINTSGHKYGLAPLGVGWVVWHTLEDLPEDLIFWVDYLGGNMPTFALNFSRPAGEIIAQYYNFLRFGREGYRDIQQSCASTAQFLADEITKLGPRTDLRRPRSVAGRLLQTAGSKRRGLYPLRSVRTRANARLADRVLSATTGAARDGRSAHIDPARRQPRHGRFAAGRPQTRDRRAAHEPGQKLGRWSELPSQLRFSLKCPEHQEGDHDNNNGRKHQG